MKPTVLKWMISGVFALCCTGISAQFFPVRERMLTESLNGTWKIKVLPGQVLPEGLSRWTDPSFNVSGWEGVEVPGNWETQGLKRPEYGRDLGDYTGLYRRTFKYRPIWQGRHVIIRFDGVHFSYTVYINGHEVGSWGSAFNMHQFDITPYLQQNGQNVLCVKVSTRSLPDQPGGTWQFDTNDDWSLTGISRDVTLFTLDNYYLKDIGFQSTVLKNKDAKVDISVAVGQFDKDKISENMLISAALIDPLEQHVIDFREKLSPGQDSLHFEGVVNHPRLWTAETPNLYRLEVCIVNPKGKVVQRVNQNVGIRTVKVDGYQLKINDVPVKLHGVCLSEIDPKLGRALTYKDRRRQLKMMKAAGVNFIRTAHYPFGPDLYTLADEMGFYVCDEVPFGYGDKNLSDDAYLPQLISRARATIARDKNHPSVIIWSIGNENPYTPIVEQVIQYVKATDPGRPRGLPQRGSDYLRYQGKQSPNVDIYMPHYLDVKRLNESLVNTDKPLILTEYAHSLGLAMDEFEEQYQNIVKQPRIIGGAIWCWTDQAILTDGRTKVMGTEKQLEPGADNTLPQMLSGVQQGVQIDQTHYMDNFGNNGADGIVYGDGYPQQDYFLVRKLYQPVQILTSALEVKPGLENDFSLTLANRFDFKSLNGYRLSWQLVENRKTLDRGAVWLDIPAQKNGTVPVKTTLPASNATEDVALHLQITDPNGQQISEKNIVLQKADYLSQLRSEAADKGIAVRVSKEGVLTIQDDHKVLLNSSLLMRVGRKQTITLESQTQKQSPRDKFNWSPYLLRPVVDRFRRQKTDSGVLYRLDCRWLSDSTVITRRGMAGSVQILVRENKVIEMGYDVHPFSGATGNLLQCGLTLMLDSAYNDFHWLGEGVYGASVGKTAFNEAGNWALNINDIRFDGNRSGVELAAAVSTVGSPAIGLWSSNGRIGIENINGRMAISQDAVITGYGSKFKAPKGRKPVRDLGTIWGKLIIFANPAAPGVNVLSTVFDLNKVVNPENPYQNSYGW